MQRQKKRKPNFLQICIWNFPKIFREVRGSSYDLESVQISGSEEGILRGVKNFDPNFSPLGGQGAPKFFFTWGLLSPR